MTIEIYRKETKNVKINKASNIGQFWVHQSDVLIFCLNVLCMFLILSPLFSVFIRNIYDLISYALKEKTMKLVPVFVSRGSAQEL